LKVTTRERAALTRAIEMAGAPVCLAISLDVTRQELISWRRVPPEYVRKCAAITGIPVAELNSDAIDEIAATLFD
jgi:hypothetical protein